MVPVESITREESVENFRNTSLLNKREVLYRLDEWMEQVKNKETPIHLCDFSRNYLYNLLLTMRHSILQTNVASIIKHGGRYVLFLEQDKLELGMESWGEDELFDKNGHPVPWAMEEGEEEKEETKSDSFHYTRLVRLPVETLSLEDWSIYNNVKIGTARQWIKRGRLPFVKKNGAIRVSALQYTPDAYNASKHTHYSFRNVTISQEEAEKFPCLAAKMFVLSIFPVCGGEHDGIFYVGGVGMDEETEKEVKTFGSYIEKEEKEEILSMLEEEGIFLKSNQKNYYSPLCPFEDGLVVSHFAEVAPFTNEEYNNLSRYDFSIKTETEVSFSGKEKDSRLVSSPSTKVSISASAAWKMDGYCLHRQASEEISLLKNIFGEDYPDIVVTEAMRRAGIKEVYSYPWHKHILVFDKIFVSGTLTEKDLTAFMKAADSFFKNKAGIDVGMVVFSSLLAEEPCKKKVEKALKNAGFSCVRRQRTGRAGIWYAYMPEPYKKRYSIKKEEKA